MRIEHLQLELGFGLENVGIRAFSWELRVFHVLADRNATLRSGKFIGVGFDPQIHEKHL